MIRNVELLKLQMHLYWNTSVMDKLRTDKEAARASESTRYQNRRGNITFCFVSVWNLYVDMRAEQVLKTFDKIVPRR
jgi:hypothetical protein